MHKKQRRYKKTGARNRAQGAYASRRPLSDVKSNLKDINELFLSRPGLRHIIAPLPAQQSWVEWLRAALAADLAGHVVGAVPKNGELVVFADTAPWSARLRYALAAMQGDITGRDAALTRITVRVQRHSAPPPPME
jgi:hypothetical protein